MELANGTSSKYIQVRELFRRTGGKTDDGFPSYIHQYLSALERGEWVIINKCSVRHLADGNWSIGILDYKHGFRETKRYRSMDVVYKVIVERRHHDETPGGRNRRNGRRDIPASHEPKA